MNLPRANRARRMSLTPMIDVVFLLLVFFMLAARFGQDGVIEITLTGGAGDAYSGPPRLVDVTPGGLALNGVPLALADLPAALARLMETPSDTVVLRARGGADTQRIIDVMSALGLAGLTGLVLVE